MDEKEIKNSSLDNNEELKKDDKVEKIEEYIPEQLDDNDFEKEKDKIKAEKAAKKAEKKAKKAKQKAEDSEIKLDENGNPIKTKPKMKKSKKITIVVIIILIIAIVGGVAGYLILVRNRPQNAILDFIAYINEDNWESAINLVDMQGYLTMVSIDLESKEDSNISYADYDNRYENAINDLKELGYNEIENALEYGNENYKDILELVFSNVTFTVNDVENVERIGESNLYKVTVNLTSTSSDASATGGTNIYEMYVAKKDGEYKIVGGTFAATIFYGYETLYAYTQYYAEEPAE